VSIAIVYGTKYGCAEKCAKALTERLEEKADLYNLTKGQTPDLKRYDEVIIGGSIYIGKIQKEVTNFCTSNLETLKSKKVGLFICGMQETNRDEEIRSSFPADLLKTAVAKEFFGGEFIFKKMNMMERFIVKKIAKTNQDVSNIVEANIEKLAKTMNNAK